MYRLEDVNFMKYILYVSCNIIKSAGGYVDPLREYVLLGVWYSTIPQK